MGVMAHQPFDRLLLEYISALGNDPNYLVPDIRDCYCEIDPCSRFFAVTAALRSRPFQFKPFSRRILQDQFGLEERSSARVSLRLQFLYKLLEWQILMRIRPQTHLSHPLE